MPATNSRPCAAVPSRRDDPDQSVGACAAGTRRSAARRARGRPRFVGARWRGARGSSGDWRICGVWSCDGPDRARSLRGVGV